MFVPRPPLVVRHAAPSHRACDLGRRHLGVNFVLIDVRCLVSGRSARPLRFTFARCRSSSCPAQVRGSRMIAIGSPSSSAICLPVHGMANGMPPGLASLVLPVQVFLTILIAAVGPRERPGPHQFGGSIVAVGGCAHCATAAAVMSA